MRRNVERGKLAGSFRIRIRYRGLATPFFDFLRVSDDDMSQLTRGTGWEIVEFLRADDSLYIGVLEAV